MAESGNPPPPDDPQADPWTVKSRDTRYENPWIRIEHHEVVTPGGHDGIYGVVRFKNVAVGAIPLDAQGNTYLVGQYRFPLGCYSWEIPEGGGPLGQPALLSAQRELREEVGITARRWDKILEMDLSNSVTDERVEIFVARGLDFGAADPEDTERLAIRKLPFETLYREVIEGRHRDSMTVAGVLRLKLMLLEGFSFDG